MQGSSLCSVVFAAIVLKNRCLQADGQCFDCVRVHSLVCCNNLVYNSVSLHMSLYPDRCPGSLDYRSVVQPIQRGATQLRAVLRGRTCGRALTLSFCTYTAAGAGTPLLDCCLDHGVGAWPLLDCTFLRRHTAGSITVQHVKQQCALKMLLLSPVWLLHAAWLIGGSHVCEGIVQCVEPWYACGAVISSKQQSDLQCTHALCRPAHVDECLS